MLRAPKKDAALPAAVRDLPRRIASMARRAKIEVPTDALAQLESYFALLLRWNAKINLTGLGSLEEAIGRLLLEPVAAASVLGTSPATLIDLGSGGGSPAIPLRVMRPTLKLWMVESKSRKAAFLRECVRELGLDHAVVENARAEELLARPDLTESMEFVSVRAVRIDAKFLNTAQAFLRPGGSILLFGTARSTRDDVSSPVLTLGEERDLVGTSGSRLVVLKKTIGL